MVDIQISGKDPSVLQKEAAGLFGDVGVHPEVAERLLRARSYGADGHVPGQ